MRLFLNVSPVGLPINILKALLPSSILATWPVHKLLAISPWLHYVNGTNYEVPHCEVSPTPYSRNAWAQNISLRILFSNTLSLRSSLMQETMEVTRFASPILRMSGPNSPPFHQFTYYRQVSNVGSVNTNANSCYRRAWTSDKGRLCLKWLSLSCRRRAHPQETIWDLMPRMARSTEPHQHNHSTRSSLYTIVETNL